MLVVSGEPFTWLAPETGLVDSGHPLLSLNLVEQTSDTPLTEAEEALFSKPVTLANLNGLHARPAAVFAQAAKAFSASIYLHKKQETANAKSLVAIMALQTAHGDVMQVSAAGPDAEAAIKTLAELLLTGCGEAVAGPMQVEVSAVEASSLTVLRGVCASPGSAFVQVVQIAEQNLEVNELGSTPQVERDHLSRALAEALVALQQLRDNAKSDAQADIFKAHQELLEDPGLLEVAHVLIDEGKSAGFAWRSATESAATLFKSLGNALLAERAADLADVSQRVLKQILGVRDQVMELPEGAILIAEQLTPSQTAGLDTRKVLGFATVGGGATS